MNFSPTASAVPRGSEVAVDETLGETELARGRRSPAGVGLDHPREIEAGRGLEEAGPLLASRAEPEDDHTERHR